MRYLFDVKGMTVYRVDPKNRIVGRWTAKSADEFAQVVVRLMRQQASVGEASSMAGFGDRANAKARMKSAGHDGFRLYSRWDFKHLREGRVIHQEAGIPNLYVTEGINFILTTIFKNGSPIDPWYVGIQSTDSPAVGWTMANQGTTWNQFTTVDEATWPEAVDGAIAAGEIVMTQVTFNVNASGTVYGAHLTSNSTKGATTGTLLCAVNFSASRAVQSGDDLLVTYTVGCQDDGV